MPSWAKLFLVALAGLALLFVVVQIVTGGQHGPGQHLGHGVHGESSPVAEGAIEIPVVADEFAFDPSRIVVEAGTDVAIVLTSVDMLHDFVIEELGAHVGAGPGDTEVGGFRAGSPGSYAFYCSVPGHREAGMEGTLLVRASSEEGVGGAPGSHPGNHHMP